MTFATRLARGYQRLSVVVLIHGIDRVFKMHDTVVYADAFGGTRPETDCIPADGVGIGRRELDLISRAVKGGGLNLTLVEPFGSTVLRDIFQSRARRTTYIGANASKTDVTITVGSTSALPSSGAVFIGGETILYTGKTATTLTGCTRGAYDSPTQKHLASTSKMSASGVYTSAPSWVGRRVSVLGALLDHRGEAGTSPNDFLDLGTFMIDAPPQVEDGRFWRITCAPLIDEFERKKAYVGLQSVNPTNDPPEVQSDSEWRINVDTAAPFRTSGSPVLFEHVAMRLEKSGGPRNMIGRIAGGDTLSDPQYILVIPEPGMTWPQVMFDDDEEAEAYTVTSLKRIFFATTRARRTLAYLLLSITGDQSNSSYDVLWGKERDDASLPAYRMGCGIDEDDLDVSSLFAVAPGTWWAYCLDETTPASEFMQEFCWITDSFRTVEGGQLTFKKMRDVRQTSALTIDSNVVVPGTVSVEYSEKMVFPIVKLRANYAPFTSSYDLTYTFTDFELLERFPGREDALELKFKGISIEMPDGTLAQRLRRPHPLSQSDAEAMVREWQRNFARGLVVVEVKCGVEALSVNVGDVVTLDLPEHYDFDGGTLEGVSARVTAVEPDVAGGTVALRMFAMEQVHLVTPGDEVTAVSTTTLANDTITIANGSTTNYAVGMSVRLWDCSTGASNALTIAALPSATQIRFTTSPTFTPVAGEDFVTWNTNGTNTSAAPASGYVETDYSYQMPDPPAATAGIVRRWR